MALKKAVIPVAGKGTRFLPATKAIAKEMIPIINIPMIQYVVDEVVNSNIEHIVFVTAEGKESIENYFRPHPELESFLSEKGKEKERELVQKLGSMVEISSVIQKKQKGLGHAILQAKDHVGKDPFAVLLGDDLVLAKRPVSDQLTEISQKFHQAMVIGVMEVPQEDTDKYGIVQGEVNSDDPKVVKMQSMVEKPKPAEAPSRLATPGRYILNPSIFEVLEKTTPGAGGEIQLTDAINTVCKSESVYAYQFEGDRFDTGNVMGYLNATLEFALRDENYRPAMLELMRQKLELFG